MRRAAAAAARASTSEADVPKSGKPTVDLVFIYGQPASGKLTVARALSSRTGLAVFHNHLIVDAVSAVFPFGSDEFVRLREQFWLGVIGAAAQVQRSLIFTFAPEPTVAPDFATRVREVVEAAGGRTIFVALTVSAEEQARRLIDTGRSAFGKLRSLDLLLKLRDQFSACMNAMPQPALTIDTGQATPAEAAAAILKTMSG